MKLGLICGVQTGRESWCEKKKIQERRCYNINKNRVMLVNSVRSIEQRGGLVKDYLSSAVNHPFTKRN